MKIMAVSNMYPSQSNSIRGVFVKNWVVALEQCGVEVDTQFCMAGGQVGLVSKMRKYLWLNFRFKKKLQKEKFDLIYFHFPTLTAWAVLLGLVNRGDAVFHFHGSDLLPHKPFGKIILFLFQAFYRPVRAVVVPSPYFEDVARRLLPSLEHTNIIISPSGGVDDAVFYPSEEGLDPPDVPVVGFISRISREKGIFVFLEAARLLISAGVESSFLVAGDGPALPEFLRAIEEEGIADKFDVRGPLTQSAIGDALRDIDLLMFPTRRQESLGLVGLEALACGVPVIASDIGGPCTYISHAHNGFLFPAGDALAAAEAIKLYLSGGPSFQSPMREAAVESSKPFLRGAVSRRLLAELSEGC